MFLRRLPWFVSWPKIENSQRGMFQESPTKIANIGSGISGLLADDHDIHVFEAHDCAGGHMNTVSYEAL